MVYQCYPKREKTFYKHKNAFGSTKTIQRKSKKH